MSIFTIDGSAMWLSPVACPSGDDGQVATLSCHGRLSDAWFSSGALGRTWSGIRRTDWRRRTNRHRRRRSLTGTALCSTHPFMNRFSMTRGPRYPRLGPITQVSLIAHFTLGSDFTLLLSSTLIRISFFYFNSSSFCFSSLLCSFCCPF